MDVVKCPRCEINFMRDDEECCSVCMRELRRERSAAPTEDVDMCVECGIAPAVTKEGLCAQCALDIQNFALDEDEAPTVERESRETSDGELDIISLELVEDEDEDDLLDLDLPELTAELDFDDDEEEEELEGGFLDEGEEYYSDLALSPVKVAR